MPEPTSPTDDVWTVQRILTWTTEFLAGKGVESARREAELLLAHARKCQRIRLYTDFDVPLTDDERSRMRGFVQQRSQRVPLAYITGRREFYGRDFAVGQGVLIPRPETETLVDVCLEVIPEDQPARIIEVGFGSGCIAITLARQRPLLSAIAIDPSPQAFEFASINVNEHKVADRVSLMRGSTFEPLESDMEPVDGIVSNPPYVRIDEMAELEPEVSRHEPHEALVSGDDGLDVVREIVLQASRYLKPGGWIALEVDPSQCETVVQLLHASNFQHGVIRRDLNGSDRVVSAVCGQDRVV